MWKSLRKLFCRTKTSPVPVVEVPVPPPEPEARESHSKKEIRNKMLADWMSEHGDMIRKYKFCPITGRSLYWNVRVENGRPFNTMTGEGTPEVRFSIEAEGYPHNKCLYEYKPLHRRLEIWNGLRSRTESFY
jgi:hypothetical protein